jgi:predicted dehydrogenase
MRAMMSPAPLRYGILGAANIARQFTKGLAGSELATVAAVASRGADKAQAFAAELGIARAHGSYEALLADPDIDAIYIPLPNHLHREWAIKAAAAGKHVLCEKPLAMGRAEALEMFAAARAHGVHLAEAYPYMSQPQTLRVRELLAEGAVGRVQLVSAAFCFAIAAADGTPFADPGNIRFDPKAGGGALYDAGTYAMSFVRLATGAAPARVVATARRMPSGVDYTLAATLEFASGALAQITCSFAAAAQRFATIVGDQGIIETGYANHAMADSDTLPIRIRRGTKVTVPFETEALPAGDGFRAEAESFARSIRQGTAQWNGASEAESVDTMTALEAIGESLRTGGWVNL